jgi:hypothetical protein
MEHFWSLLIAWKVLKVLGVVGAVLPRGHSSGQIHESSQRRWRGVAVVLRSVVGPLHVLGDGRVGEEGEHWRKQCHGRVCDHAEESAVPRPVLGVERKESSEHLGVRSTHASPIV